MAGETPNYRALKNKYYWLAFLFSYVFPFVYFFIKLGITRQSTEIVMPVVLVAVFAVVKLASDIPVWVEGWQPSVKKGLVRAIPKFALFIVLITLGLTLKYVLEKQMEVAFASYFETIFVLFGGMCVGAVFDAYHRMYRELYQISLGYVLGVVNKR